MSTIARDKRKQSIYLPNHMLDEALGEAARQQRSTSWIFQQAWKLAREEIMTYPEVPSDT